MPARKRQCSNCRHYEDAGVSKNGWCTHPDRKTTSGAMLLVRGGELACRNPWGSDLFESRDGNDQSREPAPPAPPPGTPSPLADDQVTSVITPPTRGVDAGGEDRVVSDRPSPRREQDDPNGAALQEQAERAHVMSRGSGPAIARARQRHLDRQRGERLDDDAEEEPIAPAQPDSVTSKAALLPTEPRNAVITQRERMDRRVSASGSADVFGIDQPVPRSEVRQRLPDLVNDPRYSTVPDIDPDFDLPLTGRNADVPDGAPSPYDSGSASPDLGAGRTIEPAPTSYEHVLHRARRIREAKHHGRAVRPRPVSVTHREPMPIRDDDGIVEPRRPTDDPVDPWQAQAERFETDGPVSVEDARFDRGGELEPTWLDAAQDEVIEADSLPPSIEDSPVRRRRNWFGTFGRRRVDRVEHDGTGNDEAAVWHSAPRQDQPIDGSGEDDRWFDEDVEPIAAEADADRRYEADEVWESADVPSPSTPERDAVREADDVIHHRDPYPVSTDHHAHQDERYGHITAHGPTVDGGTVLPDLDDLLATGTPQRVSPGPPGEERSRGTDQRARTPAPVPVEESRASRWMSPSPSTSALRASNFRDWPGGGPIRAGDSGGPGDGSAELVEDVALSLPDLDAERFDLRELVERGGELLDMDIAVAREVPRECRTCRSFHSADGGARGWCTNAWAFTHRRMVNEDDLACDSTIGCWWLPADRFWMLENGQQAGTSTPLMDAFMARISTRPERKVSTS